MNARPLATGLAHGMIAAGVASDGFVPPAPTGDPDVDGYIAAIITAGATPTPQQVNAVSAFIAAEKAGSRWTKHVRLYFPIWNHTDANEICMKSLTTMLIQPDCIQAPGSIGGDGVGAYIDTQTQLSGTGMAVENCSVWALITGENYDLAIDDSIIGSGSMAFFGLRVQFSFTPYLVFNVGGGGVAATLAPILGLFSASRLFGTASLYQRTASGRNILETTADATSGPFPEGSILVFVNDFSDDGSGSLNAFSSQTFGGFGFGLGRTDAEDAAFTANFKTLWETCTGLTLP